MEKFHPELLKQYLIYHDVGKPFCRTIDSDGKQHFTDHARISSAIWAASGGDPIAAKLMARDMDLHTLKPGQAEEYFSTCDKELLPIQLLAALSELHSNAAMFGGIDSTSFKIKWKNLDRLGRNLTNLLKETIHE